MVDAIPPAAAERRCRVEGFALGQSPEKTLQLTVRYRELRPFGALAPETVAVVHDMAKIRKLREADLTEPVSMSLLGLT